MKYNLLKSIILIFICVLFVFSTVSCAKVAQDKLAEDNPPVSEPEQTPDVDPEPDTTKETEPEVPDEPETTPEVEVPVTPVYTNPLTGEEVSEDISMNRPLAVMINNYPTAMPQLGIAEADIIYEMIVEGGITRMCAIFQDVDPETVLGSIRSSRHNYLDLVQAHDALYIHAGGSNQAYNEIAYRDIDHICAVKGPGGTLFYRDDARLATMDYEHTLCIKAETALDYFKNDSGYRTEHNEDYTCNMQFTDDVVLVNASPASNINIDFGTGKKSSYTYNENDQVYNIYQHGENYYDGNSGQTIGFKNLIIIQTTVRTIDNSGHREITLTGTGNGWFICNGEICEITWSRSDRDAQFEYTYADGTPLIFGVGKTYVGVISNSGTIEFE